jgi:beta-fructofuranosidase
MINRKGIGQRLLRRDVHRIQPELPAAGQGVPGADDRSSTDLINWNKTSEKLVVPREGYDSTEWRDPYVFWTENAQEYVLMPGARKLDGKKIRTGRTVFFTSTDLRAWDFKGDFWAPNLFYMHEMPDIFRHGDTWYLLITEYSDRSNTVYRMSRSLSGPWTAPPDDAFDGRAYYAARSYSDGNKRYLFGWVPTKEDDNDLANEGFAVPPFASSHSKLTGYPCHLGTHGDLNSQISVAQQSQAARRHQGCDCCG